jgi:hypothetical protein
MRPVPLCGRHDSVAFAECVYRFMDTSGEKGSRPETEPGPSFRTRPSVWTCAMGALGRSAMRQGWQRAREKNDSPVPRRFSCAPLRRYPQSDKRTARIRWYAPASMKPQERSCTLERVSGQEPGVNRSVDKCLSRCSSLDFHAGGQGDKPPSHARRGRVRPQRRCVEQRGQRPQTQLSRRHTNGRCLRRQTSAALFAIP